MWTKTAPTEPGYYWWRDLREYRNRNLTVVMYCAGWCFPGNEMPLEDKEMEDAGEFWSEPITPPADDRFW
jgi:hypothetical protein